MRTQGNNGWIGVDLDGTLARYDTFKGPQHIGEPIQPMVDRVQRWLAEGINVRIFTARVCGADGRDVEVVRRRIEEWCALHIGRVLPVTNEKDYSMIELWDDRCVQVQPNAGVPVHEFWQHRLDHRPMPVCEYCARQELHPAGHPCANQNAVWESNQRAQATIHYLSGIGTTFCGLTEGRATHDKQKVTCDACAKAAIEEQR